MTNDIPSETEAPKIALPSFRKVMAQSKPMTLEDLAWEAEKANDDSWIRKTLLEKSIILKQYVENTIDDYLTPKIISSDDATRSAVFRYKFHKWMKNSDGVMHGGFITCLMDSSLGYLASAFQPGAEITPTLSINVSFMNPVPAEEYVYVRAQIDDVKNRIIFSSGMMFLASDPSKTLVAASGHYYRRPKPKHSADVQPSGQ